MIIGKVIQIMWIGTIMFFLIIGGVVKLQSSSERGYHCQ